MLGTNINIYGVEAGFKIFKSVAAANPDYKNVYFASEKTGKFYIEPRVDLPEGYDPRKRPWYSIAKDKKPVVSAPYVDAAANTMTVTISMAVINNGKKAGVVGVDLNLGSLAKAVSQIKIGKTGYLFVLYKDGTLLTHPDPKLIGQNLSDKLSFIKLMIEKKNGYFEYDFKGPKFGIVRTIDEYGWTIGGGTYLFRSQRNLRRLEKFITHHFCCYAGDCIAGYLFCCPGHDQTA
ncbi:MAG: cache domain-containing protein [Desulfobacterium sp.]|nr:cache domain-containing protein [Desulfobacterium sp.]